MNSPSPRPPASQAGFSPEALDRFEAAQDQYFKALSALCRVLQQQRRSDIVSAVDVDRAEDILFAGGRITGGRRVLHGLGLLAGGAGVGELLQRALGEEGWTTGPVLVVVFCVMGGVAAIIDSARM